MTNFRVLAKRELTKRGYRPCPEEKTVFLKDIGGHSSVRIDTQTLRPKDVSLNVGLLRHDISDLRAELKLRNHVSTCKELNLVNLAGRPKFPFDSRTDKAEKLVSYLDEWLPKLEELACLEFVKAYLSYEFVDYRDKDGVGPPVDTFRPVSLESLVVDAALDGWNDEAEELLQELLPHTQRDHPDLEQDLRAWIREHPNGIEREPVTPEKQKWANEQMELSARTAITRWHEEYQADLAVLASYGWAPVTTPPEPKVFPTVYWKDVQKVFAVINFNNDSITAHNQETLFKKHYLEEFSETEPLEQSSIWYGFRKAAADVGTAMEIEEYDHAGFDVGIARIMNRLGITKSKAFRFNTEVEGNEDGIVAFNKWLDKHHDLTLVQFWAESDEWSYIPYPKNDTQTLINALETINITADTDLFYPGHPYSTTKTD